MRASELGIRYECECHCKYWLACIFRCAVHPRRNPITPVMRALCTTTWSPKAAREKLIGQSKSPNRNRLSQSTDGKREMANSILVIVFYLLVYQISTELNYLLCYIAHPFLFLRPFLRFVGLQKKIRGCLALLAAHSILRVFRYRCLFQYGCTG